MAWYIRIGFVLLLLGVAHATVKKTFNADTDWNNTDNDGFNVDDGFYADRVNADDTSTMSADRTNAKRALTKEVNFTRQCIAEGLIDQLEGRIKSLKYCFQRFSEAHYVYHDTLDDDQDIDTSDGYFYKEQDSYIKILEQVNSVLSELDVSIKSEAKPDMETQQRLFTNELIVFF
jgi:hypothetical protein